MRTSRSLAIWVAMYTRCGGNNYPPHHALNGPAKADLAPVTNSVTIALKENPANMHAVQLAVSPTSADEQKPRQRQSRAGRHASPAAMR
jgi:hypothetical protein